MIFRLASRIRSLFRLRCLFLVCGLLRRGPARGGAFPEGLGFQLHLVEAIVVIRIFLQVGQCDLCRGQRIVTRDVGLRVTQPVFQLHVHASTELIHVEGHPIDA